MSPAVFRHARFHDVRPVLLVLGAAVALGSAGAAPFSVTLSPTDPGLQCRSAQTPALTLGPAPAGAKSLALIFWDQQPNHLTGRWLVYDLPLNTRRLTPTQAAALRPAGAQAATNEAGQPGYTALCAAGRHDIYIDLYAIDVPTLGARAGTPLQTLHALIKRHKLKEVKAHLVRMVP
jgi:phosphatidylethanolamine-binding protein (PEBP) family uncharacterized protein